MYVQISSKISEKYILFVHDCLIYYANVTSATQFSGLIEREFNMSAERKADNLSEKSRCVLYEVITRELSDFSDAFVCDLIESLRIIKNTVPEKTSPNRNYITAITVNFLGLYRRITSFLKDLIN